MGWMVFFVMALAIVAAYWYGSRAMRRSLALRFADRPDMSASEFYSRFYDSSDIDEALVTEAIEHIAAELELPARKLLPTDRFAKELRPERGWEFDSGLGMAFRELQAFAKKRGVVIDAAGILTIDDYVRSLASVYPDSEEKGSSTRFR